ncbi:MAG: alpha/beta hydrolase [Armatimonadetes bacterium]|nr:MAG: alpha/beta hydrolase [Armatimonadota bacterium]
MKCEAEPIGPIATAGVAPDQADMLFAHAAGFCKELWNPIITTLTDRIGPLGTLSVDTRGHGASTPHPGPFDPPSIACDLVHLLDGIDHQIVGVGHSSGGAAIARTEVLRPGTFSRMVLIEPIILPPPYERRESPLSRMATKRRRRFPSPEAASKRFARGPFGSWDPKVLDLYIEYGFDHTADGVTLRCEPNVEAEIYREGLNNDTWEYVPQITCPVTIVAGETSDSHQDPYLSALVERFADVELVIAKGYGHLVPMESPALIADIIAERVGSVV